jgi:hypothetical protein
VDDDAITAFQAALLEILADPAHPVAEPAVVAEALRARGAPDPLVAWVAAADPRMLDVARRLVARWTERDAGG